ncbi:MAG: FKBP-type peptidyl-prolyl cis-trans isomerase [Rhodospirillales bacterium]|jgi:rhodanese-related sulfurtransferase|nr:FKBP-type peptidyl-prolyl cis-trans isomerase [Rhodospirillales bacterium]MDP6883860.1 FKBP-type peptidyl-prolyl cis-trans isomerase [Rhodospirillales bacterium]
MRAIERTVLAIAAVLWAGAALADHIGELRHRDIAVGTGAEAVMNARVGVHYTGWLEDGKEFESSRGLHSPLYFVIGSGEVIPGWEEGVKGMREGGMRELIIPPDMAYGTEGKGDIPADSTLRFEVELISVERPPFIDIGNVELRRLLEDGVRIVDIRTARQWTGTGTIRGSERFTAFDEYGNLLPSFLPSLQALAPPDEELILISQWGRGSRLLAGMLAEGAGYGQIYNVTEGMGKWIAEGYPVSR